MIQEPIGEDQVKCPWCCSEALYKYGKARTGRQRFLCLMCGKQFTDGARRALFKGKPDCPECGRHMYVYKSESGILRFRCSGYPACKKYKKIRHGVNDIQK